jgi:hypothetical protein
MYVFYVVLWIILWIIFIASVEVVTWERQDISDIKEKVTNIETDLDDLLNNWFNCVTE